MPETPTQHPSKLPQTQSEAGTPKPESSSLSRTIPADLYETIIEFYRSALPVLYESITISFGPYREYGIGAMRPGDLASHFLPLAPIEARDQPSVDRPAFGLTQDTSSDHTPAFDPESHTLIHHLSSFTRCLTLRDHQSNTLCCELAPLNLPNLTTIRVFRTGRGWGHGGRCALLADIRPRRLIIAGPNHSGVGIYLEGMWSMFGSRVAPPTIREIVLLVDTSDVRWEWGADAEQRDRDLGLWDSLPATVERLTLVMPTCPDSYHARRGGLAGTGPTNSFVFRRSLPNLLCGGAKVIEIVGLETMKDVINERSVARGQGEVKESMKELLVKRGWTEEAAAERADGIVFTKWSRTECWFQGRNAMDG